MLAGSSESTLPPVIVFGIEAWRARGCREVVDMDVVAADAVLSFCILASIDVDPVR